MDDAEKAWRAIVYNGRSRLGVAFRMGAASYGYARMAGLTRRAALYAGLLCWWSYVSAKMPEPVTVASRPNSPRDY
jgi:hypothetical protein